MTTPDSIQYDVFDERSVPFRTDVREAAANEVVAWVERWGQGEEADTGMLVDEIRNVGRVPTAQEAERWSSHPDERVLLAFFQGNWNWHCEPEQAEHVGRALMERAWDICRREDVVWHPLLDRLAPRAYAPWPAEQEELGQAGGGKIGEGPAFYIEKVVRPAILALDPGERVEVAHFSQYAVRTMAVQPRDMTLEALDRIFEIAPGLVSELCVGAASDPVLARIREWALDTIAEDGLRDGREARQVLDILVSYPMRDRMGDAFHRSLLDLAEALPAGYNRMQVAEAAGKLHMVNSGEGFIGDDALRLYRLLRRNKSVVSSIVGSERTPFPVVLEIAGDTPYPTTRRLIIQRHGDRQEIRDAFATTTSRTLLRLLRKQAVGDELVGILDRLSEKEASEAMKDLHAALQDGKLELGKGMVEEIADRFLVRMIEQSPTAALDFLVDRTRNTMHPDPGARFPEVVRQLAGTPGDFWQAVRLSDADWRARLERDDWAALLETDPAEHRIASSLIGIPSAVNDLEARRRIEAEGVVWATDELFAQPRADDVGPMLCRVAERDAAWAKRLMEENPGDFLSLLSQGDLLPLLCHPDRDLRMRAVLLVSEMKGRQETPERTGRRRP